MCSVGASRSSVLKSTCQKWSYPRSGGSCSSNTIRRGTSESKSAQGQIKYIRISRMIALHSFHEKFELGAESTIRQQRTTSTHATASELSAKVQTETLSIHRNISLPTQRT
ncbi:uncharacterized protein LOC134212588 [Armigeres subalbatus]|uniref:uncharacterized protein LOC134212588 n=1 Tax=Armigeres subalbatus TaxID=124917 RepID=UPI002ED57F3D